MQRRDFDQHRDLFARGQCYRIKLDVLSLFCRPNAPLVATGQNGRKNSPYGRCKIGILHVCNLFNMIYLVSNRSNLVLKRCTLHTSTSIFFVLIFSIFSNIANAAFNPVKVTTAAHYTCALSSDGVVKCWGLNSNFSLGSDDPYDHGSYLGSMGANLPAVMLGTGIKVTDICTTWISACAATSDGKVKCWGSGQDGRLGIGKQIYESAQLGDSLEYADLNPKFKVTKLACGRNHVCAMDTLGHAKCWGANEAGQLGLGDVVSRGEQPMSNTLTDLSFNQPIAMLSGGSAHTCALLNNSVRCWGRGAEGQLGQENVSNIGNTASTKNLDKIPALRFEAPGTEIRIRKIASAEEMNCVLYEITSSNTDHVKCWGKNSDGILGVGDLNPGHGSLAKSMGPYLPEVQLGFKKIVDVQPHGRFACALSASGDVKCWGRNFIGELGTGDLDDRGGSIGQMGNNLPKVQLGLPAKAISIGPSSFHSCAILINGFIKCWGSGIRGKLGYEDERNRGALPLDMGDSLPFIHLD